MGARFTHCCISDPPFMKISLRDKKIIIRKNRFKSFRKMDDLIRFLDILPPTQQYKLKVPTYGDISPYDDIKIYRNIFLSYTAKQKVFFIEISCSPLYVSA
jgi:hypothetical protein